MSGRYCFLTFEVLVCYSFFSTLSFFCRVIIDERFCCESFMWCAHSVCRFASLHLLSPSPEAFIRVYERVNKVMPSILQ